MPKNQHRCTPACTPAWSALPTDKLFEWFVRSYGISIGFSTWGIWMDTEHSPHSIARICCSQQNYSASVLCSKIAYRPKTYQAILHGRNLFQQYIVDFAVKIRENNLRFIRDPKNQAEWRKDSYQGMKDYFQSEADRLGLEPGNLVILSSFIRGSPRYMRKLYMDFMSLVRKFGCPDLFVTFTMNASCDEVVKNLFPGLVAIIVHFTPNLLHSNHCVGEHLRLECR